MVQWLALLAHNKKVLGSNQPSYLQGGRTTCTNGKVVGLISGSSSLLLFQILGKILNPE